MNYLNSTLEVWNSLEEWKTLIVSSLVMMVTTLIMGRTFRKLVLMGIEAIAKKTSNKLDDELVATAKSDLGVTDTTIDGKDEK